MNLWMHVVCMYMDAHTQQSDNVYRLEQTSQNCIALLESTDPENEIVWFSLFALPEDYAMQALWLYIGALILTLSDLICPELRTYYCRVVL